jgi:hypothetical protein
VCKLVDAATIKEYSADSVISDASTSCDECFIVVSGCACQVKVDRTASHANQMEQKDFVGGMRIAQRFRAGETFALSALEEAEVTENITKVTIPPTFLALGPTTCISISRDAYCALVGHAVSDEKKCRIDASDEETIFESPFSALAGKPKADKKQSNVRPSGLKKVRGVPAKKVAFSAKSSKSGAVSSKADDIAIPSRLRGNLGNTGPESELKKYVRPLPKDESKNSASASHSKGDEYSSSCL